MNEMQKKAVFHINGPLLILAGAGSGKTTVLVNRIANMVKYGNSYESSDAHSVTEGDLSVLRSYLNGDDSLAEQVAAMLAERPVAPWKILAITFTNKAAGELKQRLSVMLGDKVRTFGPQPFILLVPVFCAATATCWAFPDILPFMTATIPND